MEKSPYRPSDPDMMAKLVRFVSDCPSRPNETPELAADGEVQYDYRKKQVTKHSVVRSSEFAAKSETTTDEEGVPKKSCSSTSGGSLENDKAGNAPSKKAPCKGAANATKSALQKALDDPEKTVEQFETAVKKGKGSAVFVSKSYITKMKGVRQSAGNMEDQDRERACQR